MRKTHQNSIKSFYDDATGEMITGRRAEIMRVMSEQKEPQTDRQILNILGYPDMNNVRPRITELVGKGLLEEVGNTIDPITKKTVRTVQVAA